MPGIPTPVDNISYIRISRLYACDINDPLPGLMHIPQ